MKYDSTVLHGYPAVDPTTGASSIPKYQTSTFHQQDFPESPKYNYTRFCNPTIEAAEAAVRALENAQYGVAYGSGMAAISSALLMLNQGDHVVLGANIYGGTFQIMTEMLNRFGITYTQIDESNVEAWEQAIQPNTAMFYLETPSNPLLTITDVKAVCAIAKKHDIVTVCDNTFMTPYLQHPLADGVDIVLHSATKFLGGHSDIVMGVALTNNSEYGEMLEKNKRMVGSIPGIEESWLLMRGIKTLVVRMDKACDNAQRLAEALDTMPEVKAVHYPGLASHPGHDIHMAQAKNGGAVLSFELSDEALVKRLFTGVKLPIVAVSLGGVESILSYPWSMSHACMSEEDRLKAGVTPTLIRLSVGIEDVDDLIEDIKQALEEK